MRRLGLLAVAALVVLVVLAAAGALLGPSAVLPRAAMAASYSAGNSYYVNFTVTYNGYVTVYLYGVPSASKVLLWWGLEPYTNGPWYEAVPETINGTTYYVMSSTAGNNETAMTYNSTLRAFVVTVGPFLNGTWLAFVFNVNSSAAWLHYNGQYNFNVIINPPRDTWGYTRAWQTSTCALEATAIGRPPDTVSLMYKVFSNVSGQVVVLKEGYVAMSYSPYYGNYSAVVGPLYNNTWIEWYYYDNTTGVALYNSNVSSTAPYYMHVYGSSCPVVATVTLTTTSTTTVTSTVTSTSISTTTVTYTVTTTAATVTSTSTATVTSTSTTTQTVTSTVTSTSTYTTTVTSTTTVVSPTTYTATSTVTSPVTSTVTSTVTLTRTVPSVSTTTYTTTAVSVSPTTVSVTVTKAVVPASAYAGVGAAAVVAVIAVVVAALARRR